MKYRIIDYQKGGNIRFRGRHGFDVDIETLGACRAVATRKTTAKLIVANDNNYALAA